MSWKDDLSNAREFRNKGVKYLYDRAKIYVKMENDPEFRADHKNRTSDAKVSMSVEQFLEHECADFNGGYTMLKSLITAYPEKKQWEGNRISVMILDQEKKQIEKRKEQKPSVQPRKVDVDSPFGQKPAQSLSASRVTSKTGSDQGQSDVQQKGAESQVKPQAELNSTYWNLKEETTRLKSENAQLKAENAKLKMENDKLRAELNSLKRKAKKALA